MDFANLSSFAQKKYGQNFLKDETFLEKIIEARPKNNLPIVEIGPGLGDLTRRLIQVGRVRAYEVDKRLYEYLLKKFQSPIIEGRLELIQKDILTHSGSLLEEAFVLIANLPYYIATTIILNALRDENCKDILVMVQKEVAQKLSAQVGQKEFTSLAILTQSVADAKILFEVPPSAFVPSPKVDSAFIHIKKRANLCDKNFEKFIKEATKQPRKKLIKNLSTSYAKEKLQKLFEKLNIPLTARPHEVEVSAYHQIYKELIKDMIDGKRKKDSRDKGSSNSS